MTLVIYASWIRTRVQLNCFRISSLSVGMLEFWIKSDYYLHVELDCSSWSMPKCWVKSSKSKKIDPSSSVMCQVLKEASHVQENSLSVRETEPSVRVIGKSLSFNAKCLGSKIGGQVDCAMLKKYESESRKKCRNLCMQSLKKKDSSLSFSTMF